MTVARISPEMMADRLEVVDSNDTLAGRADAIGHIGWHLSGDSRWENINETQAGHLDPTLSSREYIKGYTFMWAELYGLLF